MSQRFKTLIKSDLSADPFLQFEKWFKTAKKEVKLYPEAMALSTIDLEGYPTSRNVLLRGFLPPYFQFFTNYNSDKGKELIKTPQASLLFYWKDLGRQIRIWGKVEKASPLESDNYWYTRPDESRLHAWASDQSSEVADLETLKKNISAIEEKFRDKIITRPPHWGGFNLKATKFEFWQEGEFRLHHRFAYIKENESWIIKRLNP